MTDDVERERLHREVLVDAPPHVAFEVFTKRFGAWWPLEQSSVHGAGAAVAFVDDEIVKTGPGGERSVWGEVTTWEPPETLRITWHPGRARDRATTVEVTFTGLDDQTLASLSSDDPNWSAALEAFREHVASEPDEADDTWVALLHDLGPAAPEDRSQLFAEPLFREHIAFLTRLRERGWLVAAGSFADGGGSGMTIVRAPGQGRFEEVARLAREDDRSVVGGFFVCTPRPWNIGLTG
jgi:uncharacterized protein YndB with AHSA1/START domain